MGILANIETMDCPKCGKPTIKFIRKTGTTGMACIKEGFNFIGIEIDPDYCKIAEARINHLPQRLDNILKVTENAS